MIQSAAGGVLSEIRVIELAGEHGQLCGRLLADLGADVVKIEPPEGNSARTRPPFANRVEAPEASLSFAWFNANKRSAVLDLQSPDDRAQLRELLLHADVLVEDAPPGYLAALGLDPEELRAANPRLVTCSITGFGLEGPHAGFQAPDLVAFAMGGQMYVSGEPEEPPLASPYDHAYQMASITAAYGVLAALRSRLSSGVGQRVEVSAQEVLAGVQHIVANYSANGDILRRNGSRSAVGGAAAPQGVYECQDGHVYTYTLWLPHWKSLVEWMGSPDALTDPLFENRHVRSQHRELMDSFVDEFFADKGKLELFLEGQRRRCFIAAINTPAEFAQDPQVQARGFFRQVDHPALGSLPMPGMPYQLKETPLVYRRPSPRLGEHTGEILGRIEDPPAWRELTRESRNLGKPLAGVRVVDFGHAIAVPTMTRILGEFGAQVIKIESQQHYQRGRVKPSQRRLFAQQVSTFVDLNRNKLSLALNMDTEEGREVCRRLIANSDVVVNNFSPRVMRRWGLDYERLRALRPDIIAVDMPGYGLEGPHQEFIAGAVIVQSLTGIYHIWDYRRDGPPAAPASWYADYGTGIMAGMATVAALYHRDRTGQGQQIEQSQLEAVATFIAPAYMDYLVNGVNEGPIGIRSPEHAPYGPYPCRGEDRWCVIAVQTDEQWRRLVEEMGSPKWAQDPELSTAAGRLARGEDLDRRVAEWTRERTPLQVTRRLQAVGIPAGAVQDGEDLYLDPHLRARGYYQSVDFPATGPIEYPGVCVHLSATPGEVGPVAEFGEHTDYVLSEIIGYERGEIERLRAKGVFA